MFPLSVGDWGIHKHQGIVKISSVSPLEVTFCNKRGDIFRISTLRAISMILPVETNEEATEKGSSVKHDAPEVGTNRLPGIDRGWTSRPYQSEALHALTSAFEKFDRVLLALPTGSGKTFVAVKWICDHIISKGGRVVWVAHRGELLDQAYSTFIKILPPSLSNQITWWSGDKGKNHYGRVVLVSIMAAKAFPTLSTDLLVIDEAHHEPAQTYKNLQQRVRYKKSLGLTATPRRLDCKLLNYETIAYQKTFMSLVHEKWLACPEPVLPRTGLHFDLDTRMDDFSDESLSSLNNEARNTFIAQHWVQNHEKYGKTLVFAINRDHARQLTEAFRAAAPSKTVDFIVSGEGKINDRSRKVSLFREGLIDILVNCRIFTEGFDCPDVKTVFLTRPTLSVSLYLQMIGRGTRVTPTKTSFFLVDFQDDLGKFQNQLIAPWILEEESSEDVPSDDGNRDHEAKGDSIGLPECFRHDVELHPVDLQLISGYVLYKSEGGIENGFLVYKDDEEVFLEIWDRIQVMASADNAIDIADTALRKYKHLNIRRIPLDGLVGAAIALFYGRAEYVQLHISSKYQDVVDFLGDTDVDEGQQEELKSLIKDVYAIAKFTIDEIDNKLSFSLFYKSEQQCIDAAVQELKQSVQLRGVELRNSIRKIYGNHLLDTQIVEYEWERVSLSMIKTSFDSLLYVQKGR